MSNRDIAARLRRAGNFDFARAVIRGLSRRPRRIPCRFLYDQRGAELFEQICRLDEYYPTRTECRLLAQHAGAIARLAGRRPRIVEFGGCTPAKARYLFDAAQPRSYLPVDICHESLTESMLSLAAERPELEVRPIHADFTRPFPLPRGEGPLLGFFPGSTIGNMGPAEAVRFLARVRRMLGKDGALLIGVDLKKAPERLFAAYNDSQGVTAAFILNLIERINRELGGDFDCDGFAHSAIYHAGSGKMELHIVSRRPQVVHVGGRSFRFRRGDAIHAEDSHKYTPGEFHALAGQAGFAAERHWCDDDALFSLHFLRPSD